MSKILLIDADGILIKRKGYGADYALRQVGLDPEERSDFFKGPFLDCERGKLDIKQVLPEYLESWGWKEGVDKFLQIWFDYEDNPDNKVLDFIQELRQKNIYCCIIADQEKYRMDYIKNEMGFADKFDKVFCSCDLGFLKTEEGFWESVYNDLKKNFPELKKENVFAWDDDKDNVAKALEFGFGAEVYDNFEDFKYFLKKV